MSYKNRNDRFINLNDTVDLFRVKSNETSQAVGSLDNLKYVTNDSDLVAAINSLGDNFITNRITIRSELENDGPLSSGIVFGEDPLKGSARFWHTGNQTLFLDLFDSDNFIIRNGDTGDYLIRFYANEGSIALNDEIQFTKGGGIQGRIQASDAGNNTLWVQGNYINFTPTNNTNGIIRMDTLTGDFTVGGTAFIKEGIKFGDTYPDGVRNDIELSVAYNQYDSEGTPVGASGNMYLDFYVSNPSNGVVNDFVIRDGVNKDSDNIPTRTFTFENSTGSLYVHKGDIELNNEIRFNKGDGVQARIQAQDNGVDNRLYVQADEMFFTRTDNTTPEIVMYPNGNVTEQYDPGTIVAKGEIIADLALRTNGDISGKKLFVDAGASDTTGIQFGDDQARIFHNNLNTLYFDLFNQENIVYRDVTDSSVDVMGIFYGGHSVTDFPKGSFLVDGDLATKRYLKGKELRLYTTGDMTESATPEVVLNPLDDGSRSVLSFNTSESLSFVRDGSTRMTLNMDLGNSSLSVEQIRLGNASALSNDSADASIEAYGINGKNMYLTSGNKVAIRDSVASGGNATIHFYPQSSTQGTNYSESLIADLSPDRVIPAGTVAIDGDYYGRMLHTKQGITFGDFHPVDSDGSGNPVSSGTNNDISMYIAGDQITGDESGNLYVDFNTSNPSNGIVNDFILRDGVNLDSDNDATWRFRFEMSSGDLDIYSGDLNVIDGDINIQNGNLNIGGQLLSSSSMVPVGGIIMWSGSIASIPANWNLCNGTNGTPDLRSRFVVGAGGSYNVGDTGGSNSVTLTVDEIPPHTHQVPDGSVNGGDGAQNGPLTGGSLSTLSTGGGQPHENRPPYYALAYIMRIS